MLLRLPACRERTPPHVRATRSAVSSLRPSCLRLRYMPEREHRTSQRQSEQLQETKLPQLSSRTQRRRILLRNQSSESAVSRDEPKTKVFFPNGKGKVP